MPRLLLAWLLLTVLAIFPEAGLVLFMAIYHWVRLVVLVVPVVLVVQSVLVLVLLVVVLAVVMVTIIWFSLIEK